MEAVHPHRPLQRFTPWAVLAAGLLLFHFAGNSVRGYIDTPSTFVWWMKQWFMDDAETEHGPLVLILACWFFWREWKSPKASTEGPAMLAGGLLLGFSLLVHVVGLLVQQTRLSIAAVLLFLWGWSWWAGGARAGRAAFFPLILLFFSMPLEFLTDEISPKLRMAVSVSTETLSNLVGLDVVRNGSHLFSADGKFNYDVAPACSGIRSLVALLVLSLVIGRLSFTGWKRTALLGVLALPFALAGNVARLFGIVGTGRIFGQEAGVWFHDYSGFVVFLIVLGLALLTARLLQRYFPDSGGTKAEADVGAEAPLPVRFQGPAGIPSWAGLLTTMVAVAGLSLWVIQLAPSPLAGIRLTAEGKPEPLPDYLVTLSGQNLEPSKAELEVLPADTGFAHKFYRSLRDPKDTLQIMLVLSGRDRSSLHKPEICLPGQGWSVVGKETRQIPVPEMEGEVLPVTVLKISRREKLSDGSEHEMTALFTYWFIGSEDVVASHWERQWLTAVNRLFRLRFDRWAYVAVLAPVTKTGDAGEAAAWQRTQDFAKRAVPKFQIAGLKK